MGASVSSNTTRTRQELVNQVITSVIMKTGQSCSAQQSITQDLKFVYKNSITDNLTIDATLEADISCIQTASQKADLQTNISSSLKQLVEQQAQAGPNLFGIGIARNVSDQQQKIINTVSNNIDISTIQEAVARQAVGQTATFEVTDSTIKNILIKAKASAVLAAVQTDTKSASARTDLVSSMDATTKQQAIAGWTCGMCAGLFVVIIVICVVCLLMNRGGGGGGGSAAGGGAGGGGLISQILSNPDAMRAISRGGK